MNGTIEKQATLPIPKTQACGPTLMERRQAEKCIAELERLAETGLSIEQIERFLRALAVLRS